jgi:outer membrane protein
MFMREIRVGTVFKRLSVLFICACCVVSPNLVQAETLYGAMAKAYNDNPDLIAARASQRALDESIAIAKAGGRPSLSGTATATYKNVDGTVSKSSEVELSISQSLFDGFKNKNSVLAANSRILAGQQSLLSNEMDILISVVQSYVDVLLNQQISSIRNQNLDFLVEQLSAARARLDAGEGTRTDVAQAQASLAAAKAQLVAANTNLKSSSAIYKQVVGVKPRGLKVPKIPKGVLPRNLNTALGLGLQNHPALVSARLSIDASAYDIEVSRSALLPGVNLSGSLSETNQGVSEAKIGATLSIPIYAGGANAAKLRQSQETLGQVQIQLDSARRLIEQIVIDAWVNYQSAQASITANEAQVRAAGIALRGAVEERKAGQRTILDVLNAQAVVLDAREALTQSRRNYIVAAYNILYSTGQLTTSGLGLNVARYNPNAHYEAVKDKWFGLRMVIE